MNTLPSAIMNSNMNNMNFMSIMNAKMNPMEMMASNFGVFMSNLNNMMSKTSKSKRHIDIECLSTTTDVSEWFKRYICVRNHEKKRSDQVLLSGLPLYFTPEVKSLWDSLPENSAHKASLVGAKTYFTELFRVQCCSHAWIEWKNMAKNDSGQESNVAWAARCKNHYDTLTRLTGETVPFILLRDKIIQPCPDTIKLQCLNAVSYEALQATLRNADQLNTLNTAYSMNSEAATLKAQLAEMKVMVHQLQQAQTDNGTSMPVNTATPQKAPLHIQQRLAPNTHIKQKLFGQQHHQRQTTRRPRSARHDNDRCYECGEVGTGHYSWNCPNAQAGSRNGLPPPKRRRIGNQYTNDGRKQTCQTCGKQHLGRCRLLNMYPQQPVFHPQPFIPQRYAPTQQPYIPRQQFVPQQQGSQQQQQQIMPQQQFVHQQQQFSQQRQQQQQQSHTQQHQQQHPQSIPPQHQVMVATPKGPGTPPEPIPTSGIVHEQRQVQQNH
jgi:hypothetical protein